jgi:hypothetical protein
MILPTKHISASQSYLGMGAVVLTQMEKPLTLTRLWERVRETASTTNYENLLLALSLLYSIDAIEFTDGFLKRKAR